MSGLVNGPNQVEKLTEIYQTLKDEGWVFQEWHWVHRDHEGQFTLVEALHTELKSQINIRESYDADDWS